jgi:hypothetical protein
LYEEQERKMYAGRDFSKERSLCSNPIPLGKLLYGKIPISCLQMKQTA